MRIGWSQAEFARQIGVSQNTVSKWCHVEHCDTVAARLAVKYLECLLKAMGK